MENWVADFMSQVEIGDGDECWNWKGGIDRSGYGYVYKDGLRCIASRIMYELHTGSILGRVNIGRSCRNKKCVNPAHMKPGRYFRAVKGLSPHLRGHKPYIPSTHCPYGHEMSGDNLITFNRRGVVQRQCKACTQQGLKEYKEFMSHRIAHTGSGDTQVTRESNNGQIAAHAK